MTNVVMPQMGESIAEGTIVRWIKKVGDAIDRDEPLFEISTDKVDAEIPSPAAGVLTEIKGADSFVSSVAAKRDSELIHLRQEAWSVPWTMTLDPKVQTETMTAFIAATGIGDIPTGSIKYKTIFAVGLTLFVMTLALNLFAIKMVRRFREVYV